MSRMISIKVSPQAAGVMMHALSHHIQAKMRQEHPLEYQQDIADLIAELRSYQKLKIAHAHHVAECECCDVS